MFQRMLLLCSLALPSAQADYIWRGGYETGDVNQWHITSDTDRANMGQIPKYGRPPEYNGDGSLVEVVTSPVRNGTYSCRITVHNQIDGPPEPEPCDSNGTNCTRRRTELTLQGTMSEYYDGMPYLSHRWMSFSIYLPSNWDTNNHSGWGPTVWQLKSALDNHGMGSALTIRLQDNSWELRHHWNPTLWPDRDVYDPWQYGMEYTRTRPQLDGSDNFADQLQDYPDPVTSQAALASIFKGGWTDWVMEAVLDSKGSNNNGTGFWKVWKREGNGQWEFILDVRPAVVTLGNLTFDRGIGFNVPGGVGIPGPDNGGYGPKAGMYMLSGQVWPLSRSRTLYNDNIKVGDENSTFAEMSPDGSSPGNPTWQQLQQITTLVVTPEPIVATFPTFDKGPGAFVNKGRKFYRLQAIKMREKQELGFLEDLFK